MDPNELKNKTVLILGAAKTGLASAKFLVNKVKRVLLSDNKEQSFDIQEEIQYLEKLGVEVEFNKNSTEFIDKADLVVISPGISPRTEIVKKLNQSKIPIVSDIELGTYFTNKPIIAITGTNGKTTTTSLITHIINKSNKKAIACGNIGRPFIDAVNKYDADIDYYVLEISSFQIFYSHTLSCNIAICLNITPDHLDWHNDLNHYIESKAKLFSQQKNNSWSILNLNDPITKNFKTNNNIFYFSYDLPTKTKLDSLSHLAFYENQYLKVKMQNTIENIIHKDELKILGLHNIENTLASIATSKIINIENNIINNAIKVFEGVEHRLEYVKKVHGKEFYNDSKATNPDSTIKAIEAISNKYGKNITLILGGRDKNTDLTKMINTIKGNINEVILFGEAKERFEKELTKNSYKELKTVQNLIEAIAKSLQSKTDVVLFSPACASFDMFKNYEERGKIFKELVSKL